MVNDAEKALLGQLPDYFADIKEMKQIMKSHGYALNDLDKKMEQVSANHYIGTCDAETIVYYENLFGVKYQFGETLDFRKARILNKLNLAVPFSKGFLDAKLEELYGTEYSMQENPEECKITIKVTSDRYGAIDLLYDLLWDIVPAHLQIIANQETTSYAKGGRLYTAGIISKTLVQRIGG